MYESTPDHAIPLSERGQKMTDIAGKRCCHTFVLDSAVNQHTDYFRMQNSEIPGVSTWVPCLSKSDTPETVSLQASGVPLPAYQRDSITASED